MNLIVSLDGRVVRGNDIYFFLFPHEKNRNSVSLTLYFPPKEPLSGLQFSFFFLVSDLRDKIRKFTISIKN